MPLPDYLADLIEKIQITAKSIGRPILDRELNNLAKWKRGMVDVEAMEKRIVRSVSSEMSEEIRLKRIALSSRKLSRHLTQSTTNSTRSTSKTTFPQNHSK